MNDCNCNSFQPFKQGVEILLTAMSSEKTCPDSVPDVPPTDMSVGAVPVVLHKVSDVALHVSLATLFTTAPKDGYPSDDEANQIPASSSHQGEAGGNPDDGNDGSGNDPDGNDGSGDNPDESGGSDDGSDGGDPDDEPESEADEPTDKCQNCQLLSVELNNLNARCQALELVIHNGFHKGTPLPDDQLELVHRLDEIKEAMNDTKFRLQEVRRENNYQFAIYAKCRSTNTTKMTHMPQSFTVSKMKEEIMVLFQYPKVSKKERTFEIVEGALTYVDGRKVTPPLKWLTKDENRRQLKTLMSNTVLIEFSERIKGGGVMRTINKDNKVTKREFIDKMQREICNKVKDKDFGFDLKSEKAVLEYIMNFAGSPAELFQVAIDAMDEPMLLEFQTLMTENSGKTGTTEDKMEAFTVKVLGARFRKLDAVIADCENLKSALVLSMVKKYADWTLKGSRFDHSSLLHLISTRLANLKGSGASIVDVAKAFQDMQI